MSAEFTLGQPVMFTNPLERRVGEYERTNGTSREPKTWEPPKTYPPGHPLFDYRDRVPVRGVIVGKRTLADGYRIYNGPDEGLAFTPTSRFPAYMVAFDMNRKPALVRPEDIAPVVEAGNEITVVVPAVPYPGGRSQAHFMTTAGDNLASGYKIGGSNVTYTVATLLGRVGAALRLKGL